MPSDNASSSFEFRLERTIHVRRGGDETTGLLTIGAIRWPQAADVIASGHQNLSKKTMAVSSVTTSARNLDTLKNRRLGREQAPDSFGLFYFR